MSEPIDIIILPGDGIGPAVAEAARRIVEAAMPPGAVRFKTHLFGGAAIDAHGEPLPAATLEACRAADAVLLGAVGGPTWDELPQGQRPEAGILRLRRELGAFANIRPVSTNMTGQTGRYGEFDLVVVRELTGGIYFGEPRGRMGAGAVPGHDEQAVNTMRYSRPEVERIAVIGMREA
ncbi:MAG: 3-isopropylmalate dehydrogenase, partial [Rhodothermales bacterium]|nr:3-isopropylmalate dehydrogenase [Rhodothermales bacterium]